MLSEIDTLMQREALPTRAEVVRRLLHTSIATLKKEAIPNGA
jgi:hypothetical protein